MKILKKKFGGIFAALAELLVGILLLINPVGFTQAIMMGTGVLLLLAALVCFVKYFRADAQTARMEQNLFKGLLTALGGYFCLTRSTWLAAAFPVLTILYGVVTLVSGLGKVQWTVDALRARQNRWFLMAISAAVSVVCGLVILLNPFTTTAVLWTFTGIAIIAEAVLDIVALIFSKQQEVTAEAAE